MTRIIALTNNKGGVAKTTSTLNIASGLKNHGKRVLMIDLDSQASLTISLGVQPEQFKNNSIVQVLEETLDITQTILKLNNGLYLIASNMYLKETNNKIANKHFKEFILKKQIDKIKDNFDYILLDCPPSINNLTINGLMASNEVFIPIASEYLALTGAGQLIDEINELREGNNDLKITGLFVTRYDGRRNLDSQVYEVLKEQYNDLVFNTIINTNVAVAEAPSHQKDIFTYAPNSQGAIDYENLVKEILKMEVKK